MTQEQLRMQMLAGIITEGQYKAKLNILNENENENMFNDNNKAFGILFRKATPEDEFPGDDYVWEYDNVKEFMEYLGYGDESWDVEGEFTSYANPGSEGDLEALGNPSIPVEEFTIGMYRKSIEDEYEKPD
jgi:hypothetical protein